MRKKNHENFIAKLMMTKDIIDAAELEKHIRNVVGYREYPARCFAMNMAKSRDMQGKMLSP